MLCVNDLLTVATVDKSLTLSLIHSTSAILQMSPTVSKSPVPSVQELPFLEVWLLSFGLGIAMVAVVGSSST